MANPNVVLAATTGLNSHPNEFTIPPGATTVAENVSFNRDGLPERRNGFADFSSNLPDFNPKQLLTGSNGTDRYLNLDGGIWYYDTSSSRWLRKRGNYFMAASRCVCVTGGFAYLTTYKHTIVKISLTTGEQTVLAGRHGVSGTADGTGGAARFNTPVGLTTDGTNLYVGDAVNHTIRKIVISTGVVTTLAGTAGAANSTDGTGSAARFNGPTGIATDGTNLYVTDTNNHTIRKIVISSAVVTTFAGTAGAADVTDGTGTAARFEFPSGITALSTTHLYVSDTSNHTIRQIVISSAAVTTLAGTANTPGTTDATGTAAKFDDPIGITTDGTNLYVCDSDNFTIRKIVISSGVVTTIAGTAGSAGSADGVGASATFSEPFGIAYDGADLLVCDFTGAAMLRKVYLSTATPYVATLTGANGSVIIDTNTNNATEGILRGPDVSTAERRMRAFEMLGNSYFATHRGVCKSTSVSSTIGGAGLPRALDPSVTMGAGTIIANGSSRAYRIVWGLRDDNNNLILGDRSGRVVGTASGATQNATLAWPIPPEITTEHIYQVYATSISTTDPDDDMVLIYENNPTTTQLSNGAVSYTDTIPDAFRNVGTPLYSNTQQEGAASGNAPPPLARDVCEFRGHAFYANYTDKHRMNLHLVDAASLVAATSTVTIGGVVFTADTAETVSSGTFQKFTAGTAAQNVENTAKSLVRVINGYAANTQFWAWYVSTPTTVPGKIVIEERSIGGSAFVAVANNSTCGNCFVPPLPTSGSNYTSVADRRKNRIRVSKLQQPEHCPLARELVVGAENDEIQRVIALRDYVIVIKDRTIWSIRGSVFEDFVAVQVDDTTSCAGRDSYAKLNNTIFGLSNQGFIAITDGGVQIVGRPEEQRVLAGLAVKNAPDHDTFVGVGNEVKRLYLCRAYDAAAGTNICYAYNAITRQWSRWKLDPDCLSVAGDRIYYGLNNDQGHVLQERDSRRDGVAAYRDMAEESATFTISSIDSAAGTATGTFAAGVTYTGSAHNTGSIGYGWKLYDGANQYLVLSESGGVLTLNTVAGLTTGAKTVYRPIPVDLEWAPIFAGNPGELKQFGPYVIRAETQNAYKASVYFANERDAKTDPVSTTWADQPSAVDAYIATDGEPSDDNHDFAATPGNVVPANTITGDVVKERAIGQQLSVRVYHSVAEARFSPKALVMQARSLASNAVKQ